MEHNNNNNTEISYVTKEYDETGGITTYDFNFQGGILRYWNNDLNVSEASPVTFLDSKMRIEMYTSYFYELTKIL